MARYVDTDDFDAVCDARAALFDDGAGAFSSTLFERAADIASALARSAAENAGYDTGDGTSSSNDMVKALALCGLVQIAYGRRQEEVPTATQAILGGLLEAARTGELPIPDLTVDPSTAVGGVTSTNRSVTSSSGRPPIFKNIADVR